MTDIKKYRVLCTKEKFSDHLYIDIAPENGTTHEMIFYSRMRLHHTISNIGLEDYGTGSIYLEVNSAGECTINFAQNDPGPQKPLERQYFLKSCDRLRPMIIQTYQRMIAANKTSTIDYLMNAIETEAYKDSLQEQIQPANFKLKHQNDLHMTTQKQDRVQTLHEEETLKIRQQFAQMRRHREISNYYAAIRDQQMSPIDRMRLKLMRDGD